MTPKTIERRAWDAVVLLIVAYSVFYTPFQLGFLSHVENSRSALGVEIIVSCLFALDILVNFRSAFKDKTGSWAFDAPTVARKYFRGWLVWDVLCIPPWDLLLSSIFSTNDPVLNQWFRLGKLIRFSKAIKVLGGDFIRRVERALDISFNTMRIIRFVVFVLTVAHILGCLFWFITTIQPFRETWSVEDELLSAPPYVQWVTALYWASCTSLTVGYGDISPVSVLGKCFVVFAMMTGTGLYAYIIGNMCMLVQSLDGAEIAFRETQDDLNTYMKATSVPKGLRYRIRKYCLFKRDTGRNINEKEVLSSLSPAIKQEVLLHRHIGLFQKVSLFSSCPNSVLGRIATAMKSEVFGPNELIWKAGDQGSFGVLVQAGRLHLESDGALIMAGKAGDLIGDKVLIGSAGCRRRWFTLRTVGFCDVLCIPHDILEFCEEQSSQCAAQMRAELVKRRWQLLFHCTAFCDTLRLCGTDDRQRRSILLALAMREQTTTVRSAGRSMEDRIGAVERLLSDQTAVLAEVLRLVTAAAAKTVRKKATSPRKATATR